MSKEKVTPEKKVEAVKAYLAGKGSYETISKMYGVGPSVLKEWVLRYKEGGVLAFKKQCHLTVYSKELKRKAALEYLAGEGSLRKISAKYGLRSDRQLRQWIQVYNSGKDFKQKRSGGSRMNKARKTTLEERIEIVRHCLENGSNYGKTALTYDVSYQQVYTWVHKFTQLGEAGLEDRRGKRKEAQQPRSELEEMKIRLAKMEHELYMTRMERDLLKKLDDLERRGASRK